MKKYIEVEKNLVYFDKVHYSSVDCSFLRMQNIVFVGEDDEGFWCEKTPFNGKERIVPENQIKDLFIAAERIFKENEEKQKPTEKQIRMSELLFLLSSSDYKDLPSYDKRGTPEWTQLMAQRQAWREEIRTLEGE
jgi:hypothetical protein